MSQLPGINPWWSIWLKPKETIRAIVIHDKKYQFTLLSAFYGFLYLLNLAPLYMKGNQDSVLLTLIVSLILAIPVGWIVLSITSLVIFWVGKLIQGKASYYEVRAAFSWSSVPTFFNIIVILFFLSMFGGTIYDTNMIKSLSIMGMNVAFLPTFFQWILGIWVFVLLLHTLVEVQRVSIWMALLNLVLMSILFGIVFTGVTWALGGTLQNSH